MNDSNISRRDFVAQTLVGLAAAPALEIAAETSHVMRRYRLAIWDGGRACTSCASAHIRTTRSRAAAARWPAMCKRGIVSRSSILSRRGRDRGQVAP